MNFQEWKKLRACPFITKRCNVVLYVLLFSGTLFVGPAFAEVPVPQRVEKEKYRNCQKETRDLKELNGIGRQFKLIDQFDLDFDGVCELYVELTMHSGSGGYSEFIFQKQGEGYVELVRLFGFYVELAEARNGYLQLIYHEKRRSPEGGKYAATVAYAYDGSKYEKLEVSELNTSQLNTLGEKHYRNREYKLALESFERALNVRTKYDLAFNVRNNLALTCIKLKRYDRAVEVLESLISGIVEDKPGNTNDLAAAYFNLGLVYENQGKLKEALGYYRKSEDTSPSKGRAKKVEKIKNLIAATD